MKTLLTRFRTSLRFRLGLGLAVMLLPLLALGASSIWSSRQMITALETVASTEREELRPVMTLQKLVLRAAMPPNDYLILGSREERILFADLVREIDASFLGLMRGGRFEEKQEQVLLATAHAEWQAAREAGAAILAVPRPLGNAEAATRMKVLDYHIGRVSDTLDLLNDAVQAEMGEQELAARTVRARSMLILAVVFLSAIGIAVAGGVMLSRSITIPIQALQDGVFRFSQGDHSFRVALERSDEFGHLAQTLNLMASRIEYDSLTGVYSRQEFHRRLKNEVERSARYGHAFSLLMVDLDRFKQVNDTFGHQAGDDVLRAVTMRLLKDFRSADCLARYGGEEFAAILPETGAAGARHVAERLRSAVASEPVPATQGALIDVTVSIGIASFPADARSEDDMIAAADAALYAAKAAGRNAVMAYDPSLEPGRTSRSARVSATGMLRTDEPKG